MPEILTDGPQASARTCLERELLGPQRRITDEELATRLEGLEPNVAQEVAEFLRRPVKASHRRLRARLDGLVERCRDAVQAAPEHFRSEDLMFFDDVEAIADSAEALGFSSAAESATRRLVHEVEAIRFDFGALAELPWTLQWLLTLARSRLSGERFGTAGGYVGGLLIGGYVREVVVETGVSDVGALRADWSSSRSVVRDQLDVATRVAIRRSMGEIPEDSFNSRLRRSRDYRICLAAIDVYLAESHPPGQRPYRVDDGDQIRRDVSLWTRVKIEGESPLELAGEAADRFEHESETFLIRDGGKRARYPTTERGVQIAVERANHLLQ